MDNQNEIQLTREAQKQQEMTQQVNELFALKSEHLENFERGPRTLEQQEHHEAMVDSMRHALRTAVPVVIPRKMTQAEQYSRTKAKETLSASKRKKYIKKEGHPLYRKEQNALLAEKLDKESQERYQMRKSLAEEIDGFQEMSVCEKELILKLVDSENPMVVKSRIEEFTDKTKRFDVINNYVKELMSINLEGINLSSDQILLSQDHMFRRMEELVVGISGMMRLYPNYKDMIEHDVKFLLDDKLGRVKKLSDYYRAKKILMTDKYYRSHLNSEVSYVADEKASLEQNRATEKLWMVEGKIANLKLSHLVSRRNESFKDNDSEEVLNVARRLTAGDTEPGKNTEPPAEKRHMGMLRQFKEEHPELVERLDGSRNVHYQIYGSEHSSSESITRHLHNFSWLRATQVMSDEDLREMLMQLSKRPEDPMNEQQVKEARESNIAGAKAFKSLMRLQMDYLSRKYGAGFFSMKMEEQMAHQEEFADDFANMQGFGSMLEYLRKEPGLWEPEDEKLLKIYTCQQISFLALIGTRRFFLNELEHNRKTSYADWKIMYATTVVDSEGSQIDFMECLESVKDEHLDVRWDTPFSLTDMVDVFLDAERFAQRQNKYVKDQKINPNNWAAYFPDLNIDESHRIEFLMKMVEKQSAPALEVRASEWRQRGATAGSMYLPGIGTSDFPVVNQFFNKILANPADYHLTAEDTAHFESLMQDWKKSAVEIGRFEFLSNEALTISDKFRGVRGKDARAVAARKLKQELSDVGDKYFDQMREVFKGVTDTYNHLLSFTSEHSLFIYDMHKDIFKRLIEDEAAKLEPTEEIPLGSVTIPAFAVNKQHPKYSLQSVLQGRHLREGENPEEFLNDVTEANRLIARLMKESVIVDEGREHGGELDNLDCLKEVPRKKGFFVYETFNRASVDAEKLEAIQKKLVARTDANS